MCIYIHIYTYIYICYMRNITTAGNISGWTIEWLVRSCLIEYGMVVYDDDCDTIYYVI